MRVTQVSIRNCKAFDELELSLVDPATQRPFALVALTGDNGSGKTTTLEAVALACESPTLPSQWVRRVGQPASIGVELAFVADELDALHKEIERSGVDELMIALGRDNGLPSATDSTLWLAARNPKRRGEPEHHTGVFVAPNYRRGFRKVASQSSGWRVSLLRNDRSLPPQQATQVNRVDPLPNCFVLRDFGYANLKQHLVNLDYLRLRRQERGGSDLFEPYRRMVSRLFKDKTFEGIGDDFQVLFRTSDGHLVDFDQLSSGERSVLALYSAMIRPELSHSVFLIDEPEQHLHPSWQSALPEILADNARRTGNQFILATHSVEIAEGVQEADGGVFSLTPSDAPVEGAPA